MAGLFSADAVYVWGDEELTKHGYLNPPNGPVDQKH